MIKILHLVNKLGAGGAERQLFYIIKHTDRTRFSHQIATLKGEGILDRIFLDSGINLLNLNVHCMSHPFEMFRTIIKLWFFMLLEGIDILHSWLFHPNFYASLLKPLMPGLGLIVSKQGQNFWYRRQHFLLNKYVYNITDAIFVNSQNLKDSILSYMPYVKNKIFIIPNVVHVPPAIEPIPSEVAKAREAGCFIVGVVGRLCIEKEPLHVLEALSVLKDRIPNILVVFLGDGPLMGDCRDYARKMHIEHLTLFAGYQEDVYPWYSSFHLYLLASSYESLPNSLIEAQAMAIPTVATHIGEIPRIIDDGVNGILIQPRDTKAIVDAVSRLYAEPEVAAALGQEGKRRSSDFSISRIVDYEHMYLKVARP